MTTPTDTPRTDAVDRQAQSIVSNAHFGASTADTINAIVALYSEHAQRLERSLGPAYACNEDLGHRIGKLQQELKEAQGREAICHCGELVSAHHMGSGHSPVELPETCPNAAELATLRQEVNADYLKLAKAFDDKAQRSAKLEELLRVILDHPNIPAESVQCCRDAKAFLSLPR